MTRRLHVSEQRLRANLRRQARAPVRGTFLPNPAGTAAGLVFELDDLVIVALPGPPSELQVIVREQLIPYLAKRFGTHATGCSLTLRFVGIGQSRIDQVMKTRITLPRNVVSSTQFHGPRVDFTFALPADTAAARYTLAQLKQAFHDQLGEYIYTYTEHTSLEQVVVRQALERHETIAFVEVGTGGAVTAALGKLAEAAHVLAGGYVAPSAERARHVLEIGDQPWQAARDATTRGAILADAERWRTHASWVVATGTPQTDASAKRTVIPVVIHGPDNFQVSKNLVRQDRGDESTTALATRVLDLLRRQLLAVRNDDAQSQ